MTIQLNTGFQPWSIASLLMWESSQTNYLFLLTVSPSLSLTLFRKRSKQSIENNFTPPLWSKTCSFQNRYLSSRYMLDHNLTYILDRLFAKTKQLGWRQILDQRCLIPIWLTQLPHLWLPGCLNSHISIFIDWKLTKNLFEDGKH